MGSATRPIIAMLVVAAAAIAFWTLALSPKRDEASELSTQIEQLTSSVDAARGQLVQATAAKQKFPTAYHQLVELGQAVPATDETPSLLVELETIADHTGIGWNSISLEGGGEEVAPEAVVTPSTTESATGSTTTVPPTEVEAALMPLGASIGSAGLGVMRYSLEFEGNFFQISNFIGTIDSLVRAGKSVTVNGRLITINAFSLSPSSGEGKATGSGPTRLHANFSVTTYLTPPGQGVTAGATPTEPAAEETSQTVATE